MCEGRKENPIDVCDDSDEDLKCSEELIKSETYSIDSMAELDAASDFDADVVFADSIDVFGPMGDSNVIKKKHDEKPLELNVSLRLNTTDQLRKAKRRMEDCFIEDYSLKMKTFKRVDRPEYEGEYIYIRALFALL